MNPQLEKAIKAVTDASKGHSILILGREREDYVGSGGSLPQYTVLVNGEPFVYTLREIEHLVRMLPYTPRPDAA